MLNSVCLCVLINVAFQQQFFLSSFFLLFLCIFDFLYLVTQIHTDMWMYICKRKKNILQAFPYAYFYFYQLLLFLTIFSFSFYLYPLFFFPLKIALKIHFPLNHCNFLLCSLNCFVHLLICSYLFQFSKLFFLRCHA